MIENPKNHPDKFDILEYKERDLGGGWGLTEIKYREIEFKKGHASLIREVDQNQNESASGLPSSDGNLLAVLSRMYPTMSEWLRCVEECPTCFHRWDESLRATGGIQDTLRQWIKSGRPNVLWQDETSKCPDSENVK